MRNRRKALLLAMASAWPAVPAVAQIQGLSFTAVGNACTAPYACDEIQSTWMKNRPAASSFLTSNWNPPGSAGVYLDRHLLTTYATIVIFNYHLVVGYGGDDILPGSSFNLLAHAVPPACVFKHTTTAGNINGNVTLLDRPSLNGDSGAFVQVQEIGTEATPHPVGVYYDSASTNRWGIFNEDQVPMVAGREFWVRELCSGTPAGVNILSCNPVNGDCYVDSAGYSNGRRSAVLLVTQKWSFANAVYNPHPIGVWYDSSVQKWAIFNQDGADIPAWAEFFVSFVTTIFTSSFENDDLQAWSDTVP